MRIAISGYGKMGRVVEEIALERGHEISARIGSKSQNEWNRVNSDNTDVVIEFSTPGSALDNIKKCFEKKIPVVVGTTGWYEHIEYLETEVTDNKHCFLYASNFSIGVNLFFEVNKFLAKLIEPHHEYHGQMEESHHIHKLDSPSGTAISLAKDIIENNSRFKDWTEGISDGSDNLGIVSHRLDEVPGTHTIKYESDIDLIEIKHEAKSRKGFAFGSVIAAEWLKGKVGFFNMSDVLNVNLR